MSRRKHPRIKKFSVWLGFHWLRLFNPTFRSHPDKRKAYFEHRLSKTFLKLR